jgi:hypothetical protein
VKRFVSLALAIVVSILACGRFEADKDESGVDAGPGSDASDSGAPASDAANDSGAARGDAALPAECTFAGDQSCAPRDANGVSYPDCRSILAVYGGAPTGYYRILDRDKEQDVLCDMATAGGGWTLVGRSGTKSAGDVKDEFGWFKSSGTDLNDPDAPYSFDVADLATTPTQMLFGIRVAKTNGWGGQVYRTTFPDDFLDQPDRAYAIEVEKVIGECPGGMFQRFAGWAELENVFFFRDVQGQEEQWGLTPTGWYTGSSRGCDSAGDLGGEQGMIFVR